MCANAHYVYLKVIETFPNVKEVTIIEDKQLDVLHEVLFRIFFAYKTVKT